MCLDKKNHQRKHFPLYIQVLLKVIWIQSKSDNVVTASWIIGSINSTKLSFLNRQQQVINMTIKYCYIGVFILNIIYSITKKFHNKLVVFRSNNWRVLAIGNFPISLLITWILFLGYQGRDNYVVQTWQLQVIIMTPTNPWHNFG